MALFFTRNSLLSRTLRNAHALKVSSSRPFSTTLSAAARQSPTQTQNEGGYGRRTKPVIEDDMEELWDNLEEPDSGIEDSPSSGHLILQEQRQLLHYMRLIEHEMPKLVGKNINWPRVFPQSLLVFSKRTENLLLPQQPKNH